LRVELNWRINDYENCLFTSVHVGFKHVRKLSLCEERCEMVFSFSLIYLGKVYKVIRLIKINDSVNE